MDIEILSWLQIAGSGHLAGTQPKQAGSHGLLNKKKETFFTKEIPELSVSDYDDSGSKNVNNIKLFSNCVTSFFLMQLIL